jgi:PIN domain nuclease of toxin-antitoxin system
MKLLLDTHLLLWAAAYPDRLSRRARKLIGEPENVLFFSVASLWEVAIKNALGKRDFQADAGVLRRNLLEVGYEELAVLGEHILALRALPPIHKDPFDRLLIAQAVAEGISLLTNDVHVAQYPGPIIVS